MADDRAGRSQNGSLSTELKALVGQTTRLAKLELELARGELTGKIGSLGKGAGLLIAAGLFGFLSLCVITAAAVLALATALAAWLAALIVFACYLAAAALMASIGLRKLKHATPLVPERTVESLKGDLKWVETQLKSAER
ncbi:MAG TPA: phage holin family protein [Solirubrobacteraceae bacterium]